MSLGLALVVAGLAPPSEVRAGGVVSWGLGGEVDAHAGGIALSAGPGASVVESHGRMNLAYEKSDDIYLVSHDGTSWSAPVQVSNDLASSTSPQLAAAGNPEVLHVVWEDNRTGLAEVWTRRWDGSTWSSEECLTCYAESATIASGAPSIAGGGNWVSAYPFVAWEERRPGDTAVLGRLHDGTSWQAPEPVSDSPASASRPAVAIPNTGTFRIAWIDTRHGGDDVYVLDRGESERRVTLGGETVIALSHHAEDCCTDVILGESMLTLELANGFTSLLAVNPWQIQSIEEFAGRAGNLGGFVYPLAGCGIFGGPTGAYALGVTLPTGLPGIAEHTVRFSNLQANVFEVDMLSATGLDRIVVGAREAVPEAELVAAWVELRNGQPTLVAAQGRTDGGHVIGVHDPPPAFVIAPGGTIDNVAHVTDLYGGDPAPGWTVNVDFTPALAADITLDEGVTEPFSETSTEPDGEVRFTVSGGGCSQAGSVLLECEIFTEHVWPGVKSPDIDGDCRVDEQDRLYVEKRQGTTDFCADLDGSGFVDVADYFIVANLVGTECDVVGVGPADSPPARRVVIAPNPATGTVVVSVSRDLQGAEAIVFDAAGRHVRALGTAGATGELVWDGRDADGVRVAAGRYFVRVTPPGSPAIVRSVSILR